MSYLVQGVVGGAVGAYFGYTACKPYEPNECEKCPRVRKITALATSLITASVLTCVKYAINSPLPDLLMLTASPLIASQLAKRVESYVFNYVWNID